MKIIVKVVKKCWLEKVIGENSWHYSTGLTMPKEDKFFPYISRGATPKYRLKLREKWE